MPDKMTALLVSKEPPQQITALSPDTYTFFMYQGDNPEELLYALNNQEYDLVILDAGTVGNALAAVVREIKTAYAGIQVLVWGQAYLEADEILHSSISMDELIYRLQRCKRRRREQYSLQKMAELAARFGSITDEPKLVKDAITLACTVFNLYGVVIALKNTLYAGTIDMPYIYRSSTVTPPFQEAMTDHKPRWIQDQAGVAVLQQTDTGLILPVAGIAVGVFGSISRPLNAADWPYFELFAHQLATALNALHKQALATRRSRVVDYLQRFITLDHTRDVVNALYEMVAEQVEDAIVWVEDDVKTTDERLLDEDLPGHFVTFPIVTSKGSIGGISASGKEMDNGFIELLAYGAARALDDTTDPMLETILNGLRQALFFVDKSGRVRFVNDYFAAFTGIALEEILNKEVDVLVDHLSLVSNNAMEARHRLTSAIDEMYQPENHVMVALTVDEHLFDVEFVCIERGAFIGSLREHPKPAVTADALTPIFHILLEQAYLPFSQARSFTTTLVNEYHAFRAHDILKLLRQVQGSMEETRHLWDNLYQLVKVETAAHTLRYEETDLESLIVNLLNSGSLYRHLPRFRVETEDLLPGVNLSIPLIQQVFTNILQNAVQYSPEKSPITITMAQQGSEIQVEIHDEGEGISPTQFNKPFDLVAWSVHEKRGVSIDLYLSKILLERHGGWMHVDNDEGVSIVIGLPVNGPKIDTKEVPVVKLPEAKLHTAIPKAHETAEVAQVRVPERNLQTIMVIQGKTRFLLDYAEMLEDKGYDVLTYTSSAAALSDLSLIRLDLILLDARMPAEDSLQICNNIRQRTEVPIILVAETTSGDETVRALNMGADDFITNPSSDAEFMARINVIFKRQRLADRTSEPLQLGDLLIDFARREVSMNAEPVELTRIQYELLHTLIINRGQVLTHQQLLEKVWGPEYQGETQYLWVNISRLRKKLEKNGPETPYINNVPGIGYMFKVP